MSDYRRDQADADELHRKHVEDGWFDRQVKRASEDAKQLPPWMRQGAVPMTPADPRAAAMEHCARCGHPADWHRHNDEGCLSTHPQPRYPWTAPFRCLGYDCMKDGTHGGTPETRCGCLAYVKAEPNAER